MEEKTKNESKESNADLKFGNQEQARKASVASDAISEKVCFGRVYYPIRTDVCHPV